jgi:hypothetical protein
VHQAASAAAFDGPAHALIAPADLLSPGRSGQRRAGSWSDSIDRPALPIGFKP